MRGVWRLCRHSEASGQMRGMPKRPLGRVVPFRGGRRFGLRLRVSKSLAEEVCMESIISSLVTRFEKGALTRRELIRGLTLLAAACGTAAEAQDAGFKGANIDHVSIQVTDLQRSVDYYQRMF